MPTQIITLTKHQYRLQPSLEYLYERLVLDGDAQENWQAALSELGLSLFETE